MNVRTLCLGILWFGDATGYEINKLAAQGRFSHFIEASYGSIYPALKRLADEGLVNRREVAQPGKPTRKVYSITEAGREELLRALSGGAQPDIFKSEFLFLCLYCEALDEAHIEAALRRQRDQLQESLERLKGAHEKCDHPPSRFAIGYGIALHEAALAYLRHNAHRLETRRTAPPRAAE